MNISINNHSEKLINCSTRSARRCCMSAENRPAEVRPRLGHHLQVPLLTSYPSLIEMSLTFNGSRSLPKSRFVTSPPTAPVTFIDRQAGLSLTI